MGRVRVQAPGVTARLRATLAYWLLPAPCLECGTLERPLDRALGLCPACRGALRRLRGSRCRLCLRRLPTAGRTPGPPLCGPCGLRRPGHEGLLAAWSYEPPLDAVIHALKFGRQPHLGRQLGLALARETGPHLTGFEVIVPVPLHWRRQLARGYNQAAEIAAGLAAATALAVRPDLVRRRATRAQATLPLERRGANLRNAFAVRRAGAVRGLRCLLVDDVVTSGATLEQASRALLRAGASAVLCLAAGRTPEGRGAGGIGGPPAVLHSEQGGLGGF